MEQFEAQLKKKGFRLTNQRLAVLKAVSEFNGHFTAEDLHRHLNRSDIGIATVYRTVQLLQDMGYIRQAFLPGGSAVYEYTHDMPGHSHAHMQCLECGAVFELREDMMENMEKTVLEQYGFRVADHHITLTGLCAECAARQQGGNL